MSQNTRRLLILGCCRCCALWLLASAGGLTAQDRSLAELIARLRSPEFDVRQQATESLRKRGDAAVGALVEAAQSVDPEVRNRALALLVERAVAAPLASRAVGRQALEELAASQDRRVRAIASAALERARQTAAGLAARELTELGATLMPVVSAPPLTFNVQIGQGWKGTSDRLTLLADLGEVPWLSFESSSIDDEALKHVGGLAAAGGGPTRLFLGNSQVQGERLADLASLVRLEYLSLKQLPITDAQLAALPELPALNYLGLDGTRITDRGLRTLARYQQLQVLWLDGTAISDEGLAHLASLSSIRTLYLPATQVRGPGLVALGRLPSLTSLSLKGNQLAPASLKHVAQLEQLESLGLDATNVADWQLADLAGLKRLRVLWLTGTTIGDGAVVHLKALSGLQILHLGDTQVTKEGAAALQQALPKCQITMSSLPRAEPPAPPGAIPPRRPAAAPTGAGR